MESDPTKCSICKVTRLSYKNIFEGVCSKCDGSLSKSRIRASTKYNKLHPETQTRDIEKKREYNREYQAKKRVEAKS